jgi:ArsR family transcriptional regulator
MLTPLDRWAVVGYNAKWENKMDTDIYKRKAQIIKAMGHPSRLAMLDALREGERCVCELQRIVGTDMSTVSRHLALMKSAGLVADRKQGLQVFYRLRTPCALEVFACVEGVLQADAAELEAVLQG